MLSASARIPGTRVAPSPEYVIGSPLFDAATISLENGREFTIRRNGGDAGPYIASMTLNGAPYARTSLDYEAIVAGGELGFVASTIPVTSRGRDANMRPRSSVREHPIVPAPFVAHGERLFRGIQRVTLGTADRDAELHFTTDGSEPARRSARYTGAISISESTTLKAIAYGRDAVSPVAAFTFRRLSDFPRITLSARYAPQYAAAGDDALIDGLRGNESFKTGRWQGYRGGDLDVTLDFGAVREIRSVAMGFLQDSGSWILMPRRIIVDASNDGTSYQRLGIVENVLPEQESKPVTRDLTLQLGEAAPVRYLRVRVVSYGALPAWHPGAGEPAWFFADEIVVK